MTFARDPHTGGSSSESGTSRRLPRAAACGGGRHSTRARGLAAVCLCLVAATARGEEGAPPATFELDLERSIVVVSASRSPQQSSEAPAKVVTITAEEIRRRGYTDFEEILHDLAGFDFDKAMGVEWSTIFMRGIRSANSDRFLLIWDGVIQNDVWKQSSWISRQYPLSGIARIEVMYGPASLLWGANAFAGIINVILREEADVDGVEAWAMGGSFATRMAEVTFGKELPGGVRLMANGRYFASDEFDLNGEHWTDAAGRERRYDHDLGLLDPGEGELEDGDGDGFYDVYEDGTRKPFDGRIQHESEEWFGQVGVGWRDFDLRAFAWLRDEGDDPWYTSQTRSNGHWIPTATALSLSWQRELTGELGLRAYLIRRTSGLDEDSREPSFRAHFTGDPEDPDELAIYRLGEFKYNKLDARESRLGSLLNYDRDGLSGVLGAELTSTVNPEDYRFRTRSTEPFSASETHDERNVALFGNVQRRFGERWSLAAGLRYDRNDVAGEEGGFGDLLTPRLAAIFMPADGHSLKLLYGRSFQSPDAFRRFATDPGVRDLPSPGLDPERLESLELVYERHTGRITCSASAYVSRIEDLIAAVSIPYGDATTTKFENAGDLDVFGLELEGRLSLGEGRALVGNATYHRAEDPDGGRKTGDIAPLKANLGFELPLGERWYLYARGHYVSARDTVNFDSTSIYVVKQVDAYFAADLSASLLDLVPGLDLRLSLYNVFDADYYDPGIRSADGVKYNGAILQEPVHGFLSVVYRF